MFVILFTAQDHDEGVLTAWNDSMVHAWDQVSFSDTESEADAEELYREMPRDVIRSSDLNRRLDHEALNRVNCYFERVFDLAGRPLTRQDAEEITTNSQGDVIAILRNIISCQQQHTEALRHAAEFWRSCHDQLYNELRQFQQSMSGLPEMFLENRTEQRLIISALSLMSERLNLMQRILSELYERLVRRP